MIDNNDYYAWLLDQINVLHGKYENYLLLMQYLFSIAYVPVLIRDEDRVQGGVNLRKQYAFLESIYEDDIDQGACTVLEMLIALAQNMSFDTDDTTSRWFWEMMTNLGLDKYDDANYESKEVKAIVDRWLTRTYEPDGQGSIFPLKKYSGDVRYMEIWAQKDTYLVENYPLN